MAAEGIPRRIPQWIPHSRPTRVDGDLQAVERVLAGGHLATGPEVRAFEGEVARSCGRKWAVATSSGLAALHIALLSLDIRPGDRVAIPSFVCTALLNALRFVGAAEVLIDCARGSVNIDPEASGLAGVRAAIVPHLLGYPAPLGRIAERLRAAGGMVIEDCAMAAGAEFTGNPAGPDGGRGPGGGRKPSGEVAVFSLYATKMATCGQGGVLAGDDPAIEARARDLLDYDNREAYRVRFNYALTDIQAALARLQWGALPAFVARRRALAARFDRDIDHEAIEKWTGTRSPHREPERSEPCYFRYPLDLGTAARREMVRRSLDGAGVGAKSPVFRPIHRYLERPDGEFPCASRCQEGLLSIPIYPSLTDGEACRVIAAVNAAVGPIDRMS